MDMYNLLDKYECIMHVQCCWYCAKGTAHWSKCTAFDSRLDVVRALHLGWISTYQI